MTTRSVDRLEFFECPDNLLHGKNPFGKWRRSQLLWNRKVCIEVVLGMQKIMASSFDQLSFPKILVDGSLEAFQQGRNKDVVRLIDICPTSVHAADAIPLSPVATLGHTTF